MQGRIDNKAKDKTKAPSVFPMGLDKFIQCLFSVADLQTGISSQLPDRFFHPNRLSVGREPRISGAKSDSGGTAAMTHVATTQPRKHRTNQSLLAALLRKTASSVSVSGPAFVHTSDVCTLTHPLSVCSHCPSPFVSLHTHMRASFVCCSKGSFGWVAIF